MPNFGDFNDGGTPTAGDFLVGYAAGAAAGSDRRWQVGVGIRERLAAARTYYVRTDGSDNNSGLINSAGGALRTLAHAVDIVSRLDLHESLATIQIVAGTYASGIISLPALVADFGGVHIIGDETTPSNVVINFTTGGAGGFYAGTNSCPYQWELSGVKISNSGGPGIECDGGWLWGHDLGWGVCSAEHILAHNHGTFYGAGNETIAGNATYHWSARSGSFIRHRGATFTISGTPTFSGAFVNNQQGSMEPDGNTFSGSATGSRFNIDYGGRMQLGTNDFTYFPGNAAGTMLGGFYNEIPAASGLSNQVNDAGAAGAGVPIGGFYRNGSVLMVRVA